MTDHIEAVENAIDEALSEGVQSIKVLAAIAIQAYQQAVASEAVGKQYRCQFVDGTWSEWFEHKESFPPNHLIETRNVFAAPPAPQPRVKPLVWEVRHPNDLYIARSIFGEFGVWDGHFRAPWHIAGVAAANPKAAAQADYENRIISALESAPAPIPAGWTFSNGELVRKKSGSWWEGKVVGFYSTKQTPEGYCVQLTGPQDRYQDRGPVQIYPLSALEAAPTPEENNV